MYIAELHTQEKSVLLIALFKGTEGTLTSICAGRIKQLKENMIKVRAFFLCCKGKVIYENESDKQVEWMAGNYVLIKPKVKHRINGIITRQL